MPKITLRHLDPKIAAATSVDENNLQNEFMTFTSTLAYWLVNRAEAQSRVLRAKTALTIVSAEARIPITEAEPKLRVDDLNARIDLDPAVRATNQDLIEAEHQLAYVSAVCEALRRKGDMLVSLGAHQRALLPKGNDF